MTDIEALADRLGNGTHSVWDRMQAAAVLRAVPALIDAGEARVNATHALYRPVTAWEVANIRHIVTDADHAWRGAVAAITKATT